ncbi:MAG TPA: hypothetical protein VFE05_20125 [Longimicrobiaceae bacterium]|jgi:hypothetical protein|nr:hypothetical protein [Longimicrobiaceae bacterium]
MNHRLILSALSAAVLLSACVSVHAERLGNPATYPVVAKDQVRVYRTEADIRQPYDPIAVIWLRGETMTTNERSLVEAAKKKAGWLGANAIVLGRIEEPSTAAKIAGALLNVPTQRRTQILAVRIHTPAEARADSAAASPAR